MRSFASDNNSGVHPLVMAALNRANTDHALGYGDDKWTEEAVAKIKETFTQDCVPLFVFNGTGSNVVALQLMTRPYHSIFCAETAHIYVDECGSPVKMTGCQIRPIATPDGKLTPELMQPYLHGFGDQHHSQPRALYISQCTEMGTIYTPEELKRLTDFAHLNGMYVHMDGARIANACAALRLSFKALTVDCGVDVLSFGGTKNMSRFYSFFFYFQRSFTFLRICCFDCFIYNLSCFIFCIPDRNFHCLLASCIRYIGRYRNCDNQSCDNGYNNTNHRFPPYSIFCVFTLI